MACTSLRTVVERGATPGGTPGYLNQLLAPNDRVVITKIDGKQLALRITATTPEIIDGVADGSSESLRLTIEQIVRIERRELDGIKTVLLVVAIAGGVYVVVKAATAAAGASLLSP